MPAVHKDLTGLRFGLLRVIDASGFIGRHRAWLCVCDCGTFVTRRTRVLVDGTSTHCGCKLGRDTNRKARQKALSEKLYSSPTPDGIAMLDAITRNWG